MTPRERWQAVLSGSGPTGSLVTSGEPLRSRTALRRTSAGRTERDLWERLGVDKLIFLAPRHPRETVHTWHIPSQFEVWHVGCKYVLTKARTYLEDVIHPLRKRRQFPTSSNSTGLIPASGIRTMCARSAQVVGLPHYRSYPRTFLSLLSFAWSGKSFGRSLFKILLSSTPCSIGSAAFMKQSSSACPNELPGAFDFHSSGRRSGHADSLLIALQLPAVS